MDKHRRRVNNHQHADAQQPPRAVTRSILTPSLSYDADWNQTDDAANYTFVYDANDQLQQVKTRGTPTLVASYAYDPIGRRTGKYVARGGSTTTYFYNDQQVIEEYNGSGGTIAYYTYGDDIDERITMHRGSIDYYYHPNRLGSVYSLSNGTGGVLKRYSYTPYGSVTTSDSAYGSSGTVSTVGNPYLFTGREFDPESGFYNYRARTYDPVQGRFKQLDPVGLDFGANVGNGMAVNANRAQHDEGSVYFSRPSYYHATRRVFVGGNAADANVLPYGYCGNNPVNSADPSGLWPAPAKPDPIGYGYFCGPTRKATCVGPAGMKVPAPWPESNPPPVRRP